MADWGSACSSWCGWCGACTAGPHVDRDEPARELPPELAAKALEAWLREWPARKLATRAAIERAQQSDESKVPF